MGLFDLFQILPQHFVLFVHLHLLGLSLGLFQFYAEFLYVLPDVSCLKRVVTMRLHQSVETKFLHALEQASWVADSHDSQLRVAFMQTLNDVVNCDVGGRASHDFRFL